MADDADEDELLSLLRESEQRKQALEERRIALEERRLEHEHNKEVEARVQKERDARAAAAAQHTATMLLLAELARSIGRWP